MAASGVRSSWLASDTKRFILALIASFSWKLSSILPSIVFSDADREPTSVFSGRDGSRWDKSPAAIFAAVFSMLLRGESVRAMMRLPMRSARTMMATPTTRK